MRPSGDKVRTSDEAERVQSTSYSYKIIVRVIYSGAFKGRQARHLPRTPFATVMCKVPCFQTGPQQQLQFANTLLTKGPKVTVMHKHFSFKGPLNFTDF